MTIRTVIIGSGVAATALAHDLLAKDPQAADLGLKVVATPIPGDAMGRHGCPTFEWVDP